MFPLSGSLYFSETSPKINANGRPCENTTVRFSPARLVCDQGVSSGNVNDPHGRRRAGCLQRLVNFHRTPRHTWIHFGTSGIATRRSVVGFARGLYPCGFPAEQQRAPRNPGPFVCLRITLKHHPSRFYIWDAVCVALPVGCITACCDCWILGLSTAPS